MLNDVLDQRILVSFRQPVIKELKMLKVKRAGEVKMTRMFSVAKQVSILNLNFRSSLKALAQDF